MAPIDSAQVAVAFIAAPAAANENVDTGFPRKIRNLAETEGDHRERYDIAHQGSYLVFLTMVTLCFPDVSKLWTKLVSTLSSAGAGAAERRTAMLRCVSYWNESELRMLRFATLSSWRKHTLNTQRTEVGLRDE